jgi:two-component system nitrate/nitrite response regulator NarL
VSDHCIEPREDRPLIRVLVADSTRVKSQILSDVLARDKHFQVLETELSVAAILAVAASEKPDVVLISVLLENDPKLGFQVARQLRAAHPATRLVMLLDRSERSSAVDAFRAGASGILCRSESLKFLPRCISCVHAGQVWANSRELKYLLDALSESMSARGTANASDASILSKREQDVVTGVVDGLSNREIAHRLKLTEHTVKNYLFRIFDKLGVSSRVEVVLYAFGVVSTVPRVSVTKPSTGQTSPAKRANKVRQGPVRARRQADDATPNEQDSQKVLPI